MIRFKFIRYAKVVQVGDKWQAQSESGRSFGTYDTKAEAEKRVQQMEMFKHLKKKSWEIGDMQEPKISDEPIQKESHRYNIKRRKKHRYWSF